MKLHKLNKNILIALGWLSFSVGVLGIFLPLLPTTIFWIIAVWLWSKSSTKLTEKIYQNTRYGQGVKDFMTDGIVSRKAKYLAVSSMMISFLLLIWLTHYTQMTKLIIGLILSTVAVWLATRREKS